MPQFQAAGFEQEHSQYVTVAASQTTAQISRSGDGAAGRDYLHQVVIVPASSAAGAITILDGSTAVLTIPTLAGTGTATTCPPPYTLPIGAVCTSTKGWVITTGAAISCMAVGRFTV